MWILPLIRSLLLVLDPSLIPNGRTAPAAAGGNCGCGKLRNGELPTVSTLSTASVLWKGWERWKGSVQRRSFPHPQGRDSPSVNETHKKDFLPVILQSKSPKGREHRQARRCRVPERAQDQKALACVRVRVCARVRTVTRSEPQIVVIFPRAIKKRGVIC